MERCLTEEQITKAIINWLNSNNWEIIAYDFPQSGTGLVLHPSSCPESKNKGAIIPDIISVREKTVIFFENKVTFSLKDFEKVNKLRVTNEYLVSIEEVLSKTTYNNIKYGIGLANKKNVKKRILLHLEKIDFAVICNLDGSIEVVYDKDNVFNKCQSTK